MYVRACKYDIMRIGLSFEPTKWGFLGSDFGRYTELSH